MRSIRPSTDWYEALMRPHRVVVVGASDDPSRIGGRVLSNLIHTFSGEVIPVSNSRATVQGLTAYPSVSEVPGAIDLALIVTPPDAAVLSVAEAGRAGAKAAIVMSSGYAELGKEGVLRQHALTTAAESAGLRILGPNSVGLINYESGLTASFLHNTDDEVGGTVAVVSQSGAVASIVLDVVNNNGGKVGLLCAAGNSSDISVAELASRVLDERNIRVVVLIVESFTGVEEWRLVGNKAARLGKIAIAIKPGSTETGAKATQSHTGALAAPDDLFRAACEQFGIVVASSIRELGRLAATLAAFSGSYGYRLAIATTSGGIGALMADAAELNGLQLATFDGSSAERLASLVPAFGSWANPIDLTAQVLNDPEILLGVVETLTETTSVDLICLHGCTRATRPEVRAQFRRLVRRSPRPVVVFSQDPVIRAEFIADGILTFDDPADCVQALRAVSLRRRASSDVTIAEEPISDSNLQVVPERGNDWDYIVTLAGIEQPMTLVVGSASDAERSVESLGGRIVLKIIAEDLAHKSDIGGVIVGVTTAEGAHTSYEQLHDIATPMSGGWRIEAQAMVGGGIELVCAARRDPIFGTVLTIGLGGVLVEIIAETRVLISPVSPSTIDATIRKLCHGRLTTQSRGLTNADVGAFTRCVLSLQKIMESQTRITSMELNPVIVGNGKAVAVDVLVSADEMLGS